MRRRLNGLGMVAVLAVGMTATAGAQGGPVRGGIVAGFNSATLGGTDAEDADRLLGLVVGGYVLKPISGNLGLRVEGLYSQKGAKTSVTEDDIVAEASLKLAYLDIPILLQIEGGSSSGVTPFAHLGPSLGIKLSCDVEASAEGLSFSTSCDDAEGETNAYDIAGVLGAGLAFPVRTLRMSTGVRYQHGFTDVPKDGKVQNRVLTFLVGIEFGGRK